MKNKITVLFLFLLAVTSFGFSQAGQTSTTLSAAITGNPYPSLTIPLTSVTGITGLNAPVSEGSTLVVDRESMSVLTINTTANTATVIRGYNGSAVRGHVSGAVVWYGPPNYFTQKTVLSGSCTLANEVVNPAISSVSGDQFWCYDGQWLTNPPFGVIVGQNGTGRYRYFTATGIQASLTGLGTSTADTAGGSFCADIFVPRTFTSTGGGVLNGATVGTDLNLVYLADATGVVVANSAVAGAVTAGASAFQQRAWSPGTVTVLGPAEYFLCYQTNGTTDNFQTIKAATWVDVLTKTFTGTFGTLPNITVPTTFTADKGPFGYIY